jgi:type IV pilus secretin PilQ/predicted competence protein
MRLGPWSARAAYAAATAGVVALSAMVAGAAASSARLVGVSAESRAGAQTVIIEATEPVAYSVSRPDPRTVLVELRNVSVAGAANRVRATGGSLVSKVALEDGTALDGSAVGRVRVALTGPARHRVRSTLNTIRLELEAQRLAREPVPAEEPESIPEPAPSPDPAPAPAVPATEAAADAPSAATSITSVRASVEKGRTVVTLAGNGYLKPGRVSEADTPPPRLFLDFPGLSSTADGDTPATGGSVQRVRVALNSRSPLVTRVVVDLSRKIAYHVERTGEAGRDLAIVFEEGADVAEASSTPEAADPTPAPAPAPAPEPAVEKAPARAPVKAAAKAAAAPASLTEASGPAGIDPMAALQSQPAAQPAPSGTTQLPPSTQPASTPPATTPPATPPATTPPAPPAAPAALGPQRPTSDVTEGRKRYSGHPVSLDFQNADLRSVLRTFAEISGLNMVIDPAVQGTVDIVLTEVPWDQALEIILRGNQLGYAVDGSIVRIAPLKVLAAEEDERRKLADAQALSGELRVRTYALSYAKAQDLQALLTRSALSQRGQIQVDPRTNTLIITDLPDRLTTAENLINILDRPEPQVEVEARVVQTTRDFAREIGVQWGFNGRVSPELGNTTDLAFPNRGSIGGRTGSASGPEPSNDPRADPRERAGSVVNLPVSPANGAIGLALGSINGAFNLDVALTALERSGRGRVLSTPRLTTQNNIEAEVAQGIQIPIQTVANNTVTVQFKDAVLLLKVTPQITSANTVIMRITIENASPDFGRQVQGIPPIDTQRALTQVQVNDGATTVIGGIFVSRESYSNDRVPFFHRIPLLGWLFKREISDDESRELLIFITPRILRG